MFRCLNEMPGSTLMESVRKIKTKGDREPELGRKPHYDVGHMPFCIRKFVEAHKQSKCFAY